MAYQDEKLSKFIQAINKDAEVRRARILAESEAFNKAQLEKAETDALTDAYHLIQQDVSKMRTGIRRELSQKELKLHRAALLKRAEITESVFDRAAEEIEAFTGSADYLAFLEGVAGEAAKLFPKAPVTLYLREKDAALGQKLCPIFAGGCQVKTDDTILLGGLRIECREIGLMADETLDTRLDRQHVWFAEHSGLSVEPAK